MKRRRRAWGADLDEAGASFRVLAPGRASAEDLVEESGRPARSFALAPDGDRGAWSGRAPGLRAGALYRYQLAGEPHPLPDPISRFQPAGVDGPSEIIDPAFPWTDAAFPGIAVRGRVVYELHLGTFTPEGTLQRRARACLRSWPTSASP